MPDLIAHPEFVLKKAELLRGDQEGQVRVSFAHRTTQNKDPKELEPLDGWMILDPARFWCIDSFQCNYQIAGGRVKAQQTGSNEIATNSQGYPVLKRSTTRDKALAASDASWDYEDIIECEIRENAGLAEKEFTLSAFGLPEPQGIVWNHSGSRSYLWIIGIAAPSLAVGGYFRWRSRRRSLATASTASTAPKTGPSQTAPSRA